MDNRAPVILPGERWFAMTGDIPHRWPVDLLESNCITPTDGAAVTLLPPVLALSSTSGFGLLPGSPAVLPAAPLTLLLLVTAGVWYVREGLGEFPDDLVSRREGHPRDYHGRRVT